MWHWTLKKKNVVQSNIGINIGINKGINKEVLRCGYSPTYANCCFCFQASPAWSGSPATTSRRRKRRNSGRCDDAPGWIKLRACYPHWYSAMIIRSNYYTRWYSAFCSNANDVGASISSRGAQDDSSTSKRLKVMPVTLLVKLTEVNFLKTFHCHSLALFPKQSHVQSLVRYSGSLTDHCGACLVSD